MISSSEYYKNRDIIARMVEYCGGKADLFTMEPGKTPGSSDNLRKTTENMQCDYLVGWGKKLLEERGKEFEAVYNYSLGWLLENGFDVFRSVWDKSSILFVIDLEYYSKKYPQMAYLDQAYTFEKLEPFYQEILKGLAVYGIDPFVLTTGQGYHFVFKVANSSEAFRKMSEIGYLENTLRGKYQHLPEGTKRMRTVSEDEGKAYDAVGKLLEHFYHCLLKNCRGKNYLPLMVGDIAVGNEKMEAVSFDLSGYANPIFMRDIRLAFSTHQKHKVHAYKIGHEAARVIPIQMAIPRHVPEMLDLGLEEVYETRRHYANAASLASKIRCEIPECSAGVIKMIEEYKKTSLYGFHREFDSASQDPPEKWSETYDRFDLSRVPPCVAHALCHPNPLLLQPTQIQTLVRCLAGKKWWHPKHIAGLIRSKYERAYGWEVDFMKYDANTWADVWTRIYAGMLVDGSDDRCDFNCVSHQEKGVSWAGKPFCVRTNCGYSLGNYR